MKNIIEEHCIDLPGAMNVADTPEGIYEDDASVINVKKGAMSYEVVAFGADNQLPYVVERLVGSNTVMSEDKFFNILAGYGRGMEYMDLATRGEKTPLPTNDAEVKEFLVHNSMKRFFAEQVTDMKYYAFCACVIILNRERTKILRVVHKDACHTRFEKADEHGRIRHVLFADWKNNNAPESIEVVPLLDEHDPLGDLMARTARRKDITGQFHYAPKAQTKFAMVCRIPTVGCHYYPVPYYSAVFRDGWYDIYRLLTAAKRAKIRNGQKIRYHVEINTAFWTSRARSQGISENSPEFVQMKNDFMQTVKDCLSGATNSDKLLWSEFDSLVDGKERHHIKVNVIDTSKAGSEYNDDVAEASNVLCYADNVHPNLAGATPGKSQMNNSGSDKRELFTMKQALETLTHDMMMAVHDCIIFFNGWEKKVYPDVPMIMLTTLDQNTDAKEVSLNNDGSNGNTEGNK